MLLDPKLLTNPNKIGSGNTTQGTNDGIGKEKPEQYSQIRPETLTCREETSRLRRGPTAGRNISSERSRETAHITKPRLTNLQPKQEPILTPMKASYEAKRHTEATPQETITQPAQTFKNQIPNKPRNDILSDRNRDREAWAQEAKHQEAFEQQGRRREEETLTAAKPEPQSSAKPQLLIPKDTQRRQKKHLEGRRSHRARTTSSHDRNQNLEDYYGKT